jgi:enoyl-CoA hydratase/carnithine racemase
VQAAKRSINGTYWRDMSTWLDQEAVEALSPLLSEDRKEGMRAAAEKKRANFKGR